MKGLKWEYDKRYSLLDSTEYFAYSFSIADVIDTAEEWEKLDRCSCEMNGDTVHIRIYNILAEGGIAVLIALDNHSWTSYIQHYSDIEDFKSGYFYNYQPELSTLFVNFPNYKVGDILTGSIDITSKNLKTLNLDVLTLKGKFQCIIVKNKSR